MIKHLKASSASSSNAYSNTAQFPLANLNVEAAQIGAFFLLAVATVLPGCAIDNKQVIQNCLKQGRLALEKHEYRRALPFFKQAAKLDPGNADVQYELGRTEFLLDMKKEAIQNLSECLRLRPDCREAECYRELGQSLVIEDRAEEAIAAFSKGITKVPKSDTLFCERGCTFALTDQLDKALPDLTEAIRLSPRVAHYYKERAMIYKGMHQYANAIKDYTTEIQLDPKASVAYADRAIVYKLMGKFDLAAKDMEKSGHLGVVDLEQQYSESKEKGKGK